VTDDSALCTRLRELKDQGRPVRGTGGDDIHPSLGFNFKLTNLQAAVGLGQLEQLAARLDRMRQTYQVYLRRLEGVNGIILPPFDIKSGASPNWVDALVDKRDALYEHLLSKQMYCRRFWHPIHTQIPYKQPGDALKNASY